MVNSILSFAFKSASIINTYFIVAHGFNSANIVYDILQYVLTYFVAVIGFSFAFKSASINFSFHSGFNTTTIKVFSSKYTASLFVFLFSGTRLSKRASL